MNNGFTQHDVTVPDVGELGLTLQLPTPWETRSGDDTVALIARRPEEGAGPFADNVVVTIERLPTEGPTELEQVQGSVLIQAHSTIADFHLLDDRPSPFAGQDGWFRAYLQTAPNQVSAVTQQCFTVRGDAMVSIAVTTLPFRDDEAARLFEEIAASCRITTAGKDER